VKSVKRRRFIARFYGEMDELINQQWVDVVGDGLPCFKIPTGAVYVVVKVVELDYSGREVEK